MKSPRSKLISLLIRKKLYEEIDQIISISKQGFDVHVKTEFPEVEKLLIEFLEIELRVNSREFRLVIEPKFLNIDLAESAIDLDLAVSPIVFVSPEALKSGSGFVKFNVRSPDHLLSSTASAIENILEYFGLSVFIDIFDANKLSRLKLIAKTLGLGALVDSVIQTAYLGGFHGDSEKAQQYLDSTQIENDENYSINEVSIEKCAEKFFSYVVIRGEDAHSFLKSSLSYYAVKLQGFSMTRASQVLQISRTTLQEHLKIADQLGVSNFFEGYRQKTI
jgi:hypothetical protein